MLSRHVRAVAGCGLVLVIMACSVAPSGGVPSVATALPSTTIASATSAPSPTPAETPGRTVVADAVIPIGFGSCCPKIGPTGIWLPTSNSVIRIDPATNAVASTFSLDESSDGYGLAIDANDLWVTNFDAQTLLRLDPITGKQRAAIPTLPGPAQVLDTPGAIWIGNHHNGSVSRIDPKTDRIVQTITVGPAGGGGPLGLTPVAGGFWVGFGDTAAVVRVDTKLGKVVATVPLPDGNTNVIAVDPTHTWATFNGDNGSAVAVMNPGGNAVAATIDVGGVPGSSAWLHDGVAWLPVLPYAGTVGTVVAIDPKTNQIVDRLSIPDGTPSAIFEAFGSVWLLLDLQGKIDRFPESAFTVAN